MTSTTKSLEAIYRYLRKQLKAASLAERAAYTDLQSAWQLEHGDTDRLRIVENALKNWETKTHEVDQIHRSILDVEQTRKQLANGSPPKPATATTAPHRP